MSYSPENISAIADVLVAFLTLVGVFIASMGLRTWRNQLHGTSEYELAKRILLQTYRLRESFRIVRNPFLSVSEADPTQKETSWEIYAYERRWAVVREAYSELSVSYLEAEVMWGDLLKSQRIMLNECKTDLQMAIEMFMMMKEDKSFQSDFKNYKDTLYSTENDKFTLKIGNAVLSFETALKPFIGGKGTIRNSMNILLKYITN